jgi:glucokinase
MKEYVLGIDIGGTNIVCGVVDRKGNILVEGACSTSDFPKAENMMDEVLHKFKEMKSKLGKADKVIGIGIGAPNGNYYSGCIEHAPNLKWKGIVPIVEMFRKKFRMPVFLTNDANAAALGEMVFGGARNMKNFIVITIGTGLGSGIVCNGQIVYGHDGFAGELGHTIVYPQGRQCGCGRYGCLETYVSAGGLGKTIGEMLNISRHKSLLRDIPMEEISAYTVYDAARKKDKIAIEAFDFTGRILGMKLADAVAITSPEAIFLFGGVCKAGDYIIKPTKKSMEEHLLPIFRNKVKILKSELLDKNAAVLGAAAMVWAELEK